MEVESIAARLMLGKKEEKLAQSPVDHNVYTLGSINGHNIVIASLPSTGNTSAATVITQLRNTFKQIRFGLLVGIGGGVPIRTDNGPIHLRDVVVSKPERDHSGAIQYDPGKALEDFTFSSLWISHSTADFLAQRCAGSVNRASNQSRRSSRAPPAKDQDQFTDSSEVQISRPRQGSPRIDRRADESLDEIHYDRSSRIVVHRGTIAAGERVIKNGQLRDALAGEHGALCFEMEAAGVINDFPCLVIRGISDYADSHKNDAWQGAASASAAAYARQLFFHMPVDEVKQCAVGLAADPGSGRESNFGGKLVDQDLQNGSAHTVCYFFFKDNDDQNNLSKALCSILHQLFNNHPELIEYALQAWDKHGETIPVPEQEELWRILLRATSDPRSCKVVCIFDALDECRKDQGERFISMLSEFYQSIHSNSLKEGLMKILVTSRPYDDIRDGFQKSPSSLPAIHLRGDDMSNVIYWEINLVVRAGVAELGKNLKLPETLRQELEEKLLRMKHRTYLWLYLAIQGIETVYADSLRPEEESIDSLPSSVEHACNERNARQAQFLHFLRRPKTGLHWAVELGVVVAARRHLDANDSASRNIEDIGAVFLAAIENRSFGGTLTALLLDFIDDSIKITQEVVIAAAKNWGNGRKVMTLLLDRRAADVQITQEVVVAAAGNGGNGKDIMTLLLDRRAADVQITQEAVIAAAEKELLETVSTLQGQDSVGGSQSETLVHKGNVLNHEKDDMADDDDPLEVSSVSSHITTAREKDAKAHVAYVLANDTELRALCIRVVKELGKAEFANEGRKLLKSFYCGLLMDAKTQLEKQSVSLLKSRKGRIRISSSIAEIINSPDVEHSEAGRIAEEQIRMRTKRLEIWAEDYTHTPHADEDSHEWDAVQRRLVERMDRQPEDSEHLDSGSSHGGDSDEEFDLEGETQENFVTKVTEMENFFRNSRSFEILLDGFRELLLPQSLRDILPATSVEISTEEDKSISNQMKSFVEDFTMLDWNWWPLTPRMRALQTSEKRLIWKCVSRDLMLSDQQADHM
ncbi:unnamed protein product [Alternaria alternata]